MRGGNAAATCKEVRSSSTSTASYLRLSDSSTTKHYVIIIAIAISLETVLIRLSRSTEVSPSHINHLEDACCLAFGTSLALFTAHNYVLVVYINSRGCKNENCEANLATSSHLGAAHLPVPTWVSLIDASFPGKQKTFGPYPSQSEGKTLAATIDLCKSRKKKRLRRLTTARLYYLSHVGERLFLNHLPAPY